MGVEACELFQWFVKFLIIQPEATKVTGLNQSNPSARAIPLLPTPSVPVSSFFLSIFFLFSFFFVLFIRFKFDLLSAF